MKRYDAVVNSFGEYKVKYTLQCGPCRGSFTIQALDNCEGSRVIFADIFEMIDELDLERMEFDHLQLRFDEEGLLIEFLNDDGESVMDVDQYWNDIDRDRLIVGINIVGFEE